MSDKQWLSTGYLQSQPEAVDHEQGIIRNALIVTEGEAKGHGVFLESEFIDEVIRQGNESKSGLKARFGHPNMCSTALGTFLGRWKNFSRDTITRSDGSKAVAARGDLFLSNSAKDTPNGDLHDYVLSMAEKEGDMFGTSIVFTRGDEYQRTKSGKKVRYVWETGEDGERLRNADGEARYRYVDETGKEHDTSKDPVLDRYYVTCKKLHACDAVDDPAANDGMFSNFAQETVAGQITEFLDLHPQVWDAVEKNPGVLEALSKYGNRIDEFINRYRDYAGHNKGENAMSNEAEAGVAAPEETPATVADQESTTTPDGEGQTTAAEPAPPAEDEGTPPPAESELGTPPEPEAQTEPEPQVLSRDEFTRIADRFGNDIAAQIVREGGDYQKAMELHLESLEQANKELQAQVSELASHKSGGAVPVREHKAKKPLFNVK